MVLEIAGSRAAAGRGCPLQRGLVMTPGEGARATRADVFPRASGACGKRQKSQGAMGTLGARKSVEIIETAENVTARKKDVLRSEGSARVHARHLPRGIAAAVRGFHLEPVITPEGPRRVAGRPVARARATPMPTRFHSLFHALSGVEDIQEHVFTGLLLVSDLDGSSSCPRLTPRCSS